MKGQRRRRMLQHQRAHIEERPRFVYSFRSPWNAAAPHPELVFEFRMRVAGDLHERDVV